MAMHGPGSDVAADYGYDQVTEFRAAWAVRRAEAFVAAVSEEEGRW